MLLDAHLRAVDSLDAPRGGELREAVASDDIPVVVVMEIGSVCG